MAKLLLIEPSATRRRALNAMLQAKGFEVLAQASYQDGLSYVSQGPGQQSAPCLIVISWPEYADQRATNIFQHLKSGDWRVTPVLIMADSTDAGGVSWLMKRPSTSLLMWSDYSDAPAAIAKLLSPKDELVRGPSDAPAKLKILFVDDSPTVRVAFRRLLLAEGYQVEVASSAEEGLIKAMQMEFDIAIVDYFMPGDNGAGMVRNLRAHEKTRGIIAAIITGTYSDRVITESLAAGAVECMFKSEARELFVARMKSLARTVIDRKAIDSERRRLQGILSSVGDGVYGVNASGVIQFINPAALDVLGRPHHANLVGTPASESLHPRFEDGTPIPQAACFLSQCYRENREVAGWQTVFWGEANNAIPVECTVYPLQIDGQRQGSVVAFRDVSQRRLLEDELRYQANHDGLTKLHNRAHFEQQLQQEVTRLRNSGSERDQESLLLFVDVDRFKYVNDTAGHAAGDQLLIEASHRLRQRLRVSDTIARMGGDEYALILRNTAEQDALKLSDEFRKALASQMFVYGGKSYRISASIGVARINRSSASPSEVMQNADIACHRAKNLGRNQVCVYSGDSDDRASMDVELNWSSRLEDALKSNLFALYFQPIMPMRAIEQMLLPAEEGAIWKHLQQHSPARTQFFEVLLRLPGNEGEVFTPNAFLPTAERYNLMQDIDRWVIYHAFRALRDASGLGVRLGLSINLSAQSVCNASFADFIIDKLIEFDINGHNITFEITETRALNNVEATAVLIEKLRSLGVRFALDDFGSGFSSFTHLKQLNVDYLKIDGAFTQGIVDDSVDRAVIQAITNIARSVGKRTTAEFVDRPELIQALMQAGVDYLQGYYVGRPVENLRTAAGISMNAIPVSDQDKQSATRVEATFSPTEHRFDEPINVPYFDPFQDLTQLRLTELDLPNPDLLALEIPTARPLDEQIQLGLRAPNAAS
jgi:diguanylate cyclase (GGDEF)-like protein